MPSFPYYSVMPNTYLFFFAHPDDETVACAATIKQLVEAGENVVLVSATDGSAGEVLPAARDNLRQHGGSVAQLRRHELQQVSDLLGVTKLHILDFVDGEITNQQVWTSLKSAFIDLINQYKPQVVVTFDHSGWYFHLDHVGVSIAATLAFQESEFRPDLLFHSFMKVSRVTEKWKYIFADEQPITHVVNASQHRQVKLEALRYHASQDISRIHEKVLQEKDHQELYQLVLSSTAGEKLLAEQHLFLRSG